MDMVGDVLLRNAGSGKKNRSGLYIVTKPAGSTVGIREGSWTRKNGRRSKAAPVGQWPTGAVVLVCCLPGHIFLTEPHEHDRRLSPGGLALGSKGGAVAGAADDASAAGPLHGGDGILGILKSYGMTAIELGAQSMNDEVLTANRRGHTAQDVRRASRLIKQSGFELGLQMMTGLYKDTEQYCIDTAKEFIALHCDTVRIYPTVILKNTELGRLHESGVYDSFTFEQTTRLCAKLLDMFNKAGVAVIRMGLHASRDVEQEMIGGVYHPALREIAESILYLEKMNAVCEDGGKYVFYTDKRNISKIIGQGGANRNALSQRGISFKIKEEKGTDFRAERIG